MSPARRAAPLQVLGGVVFGLGLAISGMLQPEIVLGFLHLEDFGLLVTMGAALVVASPLYRLAPRLLQRPPAGASFEPAPSRVERHHVLGSVLFGLGWGLSGVCPGAAVASLGAGDLPILLALAGMFVGAGLERVVRAEVRR